MRKILSLSIFFLLCLTAGAEDFTYEYEGHTLTYTIIDEEARTCKLKAGEVPVYTKDTPGNDVSGDVVIPSEAKYYRHYFKVIEIPTAAFSGCSGITSVTIPDGITSIGYHAFSNCTGLTSVTIPNSVTDIGGDAFAGCTGLTSVTISNNVTSIGNGAFYICRGLTEVTIPNSVVSIGDLAFAGCSGLRSVAISNSVTAIRNQTFRGCSSLTSVTIPKSVTEIGGSVFYGCTDLTDIYILNPTPPSADHSSFDENTYKNATLYVPEEAYETYDNMTVGPWKYFLKLKSIETPTFYFDYDDKNMTAIVTEVNKDKLSSYLEIPETTKFLGKTYTVVAIGEEAFKDCSGVTMVTIPISLTSIGDGAFWGCSGLSSVCFSKNNLTHIGSSAFYGCSGLTMAPVSDSLTSIGDCAFFGCSSLTEVRIPNSVTSIGASAFMECRGLTSVAIPNSVTYISDYAFHGCSSLTSVYIPNNVTSIGGWAFQNCSGLTSITIPNSVTSIGGWAFANCNGLTSIAISNSVTSIDSYAFCNCSGLTSVTIPNSITFIDDGVFYACNNLTEVYSLNLTPPSAGADSAPFNSDIYRDATLYVPEEALEAYKNAEFWKKFRSIKSFNSSTLYYFDYNDSEMTATVTGVNKVNISSEIVIPETATYLGKTYTVVAIGKEAFKNCKDVTDVTIPNSITAIGNSAFEGCTGLTKVNISDITAWCNIKFGSAPFTPIHNLYLNGEKVKNLVIPDGVTDIGNYAFLSCYGITSVIIPNSVTSIGDHAFQNCRDLTEVYSLNLAPPSTEDDPFDDNRYLNATLHVPEKALEAYKNAEYWKKFRSIKGFNSSTLYYFDYNDSEMTATVTGVNEVNISSEMVIPETTTYLGKTYAVAAIGKSAFQNSSVTKVTIPNSITAIGEYAFDDCSKLTSVTIPNSVTSISNYAFYNCHSLASVTIPNGVTTIGNYAFSLCSGMTSLTIPNSVTSIKSWAFWGCSSLTEVTIPNSVTDMSDGAFHGCSGLTSVIIPNSVTSINFDAFSQCHGLTSVTIPNSVTEIKGWAFWDCGSLTEVTIPNSVTFIGRCAFDDCRSLTEVYSFNLTPPSCDGGDPFSSDFGEDYIYQNATLYVPDEALEAYKNAEYWKEFLHIKGFDPTGIKGIEVDGNGKRNVYYDLNGRRLSTPKKGLNIINGKKVIIK